MFRPQHDFASLSISSGNPSRAGQPARFPTPIQPVGRELVPSIMRRVVSVVSSRNLVGRRLDTAMTFMCRFSWARLCLSGVGNEKKTISLVTKQ